MHRPIHRLLFIIYVLFQNEIRHHLNFSTIRICNLFENKLLQQYSECPKTERSVCQTEPNLFQLSNVQLSNVQLSNVQLSNVRISDITGDQIKRSVCLFLALS